jgi:hypothetical protein
MSDVEDFEFPKDFKLPYTNAEERNDELQVKAEMLNEHIYLDGVKDLLKKKNYYVQAMIEEEELDIAPTQSSVDSFVKEFTLADMKTDITMLMKRLHFKSNAMSKKEFDEKQNMLKATLISIDNDDLEGITYDKMREFEEKLGLLPVDEETRRCGMEATYAERIKAFEENLEEKNRLAEECVRKWSTERRERLQKKREERRKKKNDLRAKMERKKQRDEQKKSEKDAMRKQMEEEIREKMKAHERQRQDMLEKWKQDEKELAKRRYTHIAMEEQYQRKVIIPSLERK